FAIRSGGGHPPMAFPSGGGIPTTASWLPIAPNRFDSTEPPPHIGWTSPSVRTSTFIASAGDSLSYTRFFRMGTFTVGDTAVIQAGLDSTGGDYFRASINLRRAADSAIVLVLDTARLTRSTFISSTNVADSGYGHAIIPIADSFFLTLDVARGDSTDNLTLAHIESFDDPIQDVLPPPDSSVGGFKIADPHPQALGTPQPELTVTVHPNPARTSVKVCVEDIPGGIPVTVDVVNEMGTQVAMLYNATPEAELGLCLQLDCSQLPSGIYYADLQTQGQHKAVQFTIEH